MGGLGAMADCFRQVNQVFILLIVADLKNGTPLHCKFYFIRYPHLSI